MVYYRLQAVAAKPQRRLRRRVQGSKDRAYAAGRGREGTEPVYGFRVRGLGFNLGFRASLGFRVEGDVRKDVIREIECIHYHIHTHTHICMRTYMHKCIRT